MFIPHARMAIDLSLHARAGERSAGIGDQLDTFGKPAVIQSVVSGVPSGTVSFHTDRGPVHRETLPGDGPGTIEWRTSAEESAFVRVEVRQPEQQMAAVTNPVILS